MRLIDADPLREQLKKRIEETENILMCRSLETFMRLLDLTPTADVAPVRHGRWKTYKTDVAGRGFFYCTACHADVYDTSAYCPSCGAKMDGGDTDA